MVTRSGIVSTAAKAQGFRATAMACKFLGRHPRPNCRCPSVAWRSKTQWRQLESRGRKKQVSKMRLLVLVSPARCARKHMGRNGSGRRDIAQVMKSAVQSGSSPLPRSTNTGGKMKPNHWKQAGGGGEEYRLIPPFPVRAALPRARGPAKAGVEKCAAAATARSLAAAWPQLTCWGGGGGVQTIRKPTELSAASRPKHIGLAIWLCFPEEEAPKQAAAQREEDKSRPCPRVAPRAVAGPAAAAAAASRVRWGADALLALGGHARPSGSRSLCPVFLPRKGCSRPRWSSWRAKRWCSVCAWWC